MQSILAYIIVSLKKGACLLSLVIFLALGREPKRGGKAERREGEWMSVSLHVQSRERRDLDGREHGPRAKAFTAVSAFLLSVHPAGESVTTDWCVCSVSLGPHLKHRHSHHYKPPPERYWPVPGDVWTPSERVSSQTFEDRPRPLTGAPGLSHRTSRPI